MADTEEPAGQTTEFQVFERLAKKLVGVPKAEVDALRKKQQAERRRAAARQRRD